MKKRDHDRIMRTVHKRHRTRVQIMQNDYNELQKHFDKLCNRLDELEKELREKDENQTA